LGKINDSEALNSELDFIYSRYSQASDVILDMPVVKADAIIAAGHKAIWKERCWTKWLSEDGAGKSYSAYEDEFFKVRKAPDLGKALALAEEIKRREQK
jgi:hypothetical protein